MEINNLMQMAAQLRDRLGSAQEVQGEAGGGMVKVTMNGQYELLALHIDPTTLGGALKADDLALLEDLIRAAVNQAGAKVGLALKDRVGGLAKDFGLDLAALAKKEPGK